MKKNRQKGIDIRHIVYYIPYKYQIIFNKARTNDVHPVLLRFEQLTFEKNYQYYII